MGWKVMKYLEMNHTVIQISRFEPKYDCISAVLEGDFTNLSDQELVRLTLDDFYKENYPERYTNERLNDLENRVMMNFQQVTNGNDFISLLLGDLIAVLPGVTEGMYKQWMNFFPLAQSGKHYERNQFIAVIDPNATEESNVGNLVLVRVIKPGGHTFEGNPSDVLSINRPYANGFDIRRYSSYTRYKSDKVQLKP